LLRLAPALVLSSGLLAGCIVHDHDRHDNAPPPQSKGGGEVSKHPHGGPPGQTGQHPHGGPPGQTRKVVVVEASHVCLEVCLHFCIDGVWYLEDGHKHGGECGHFLVDGKWGNAKGHDMDKGKGKGKDKK
jgi:hypothetical protein